MAESAQLSGLAISDSAPLDAPRHSALVRITHWITTFSFVGLVVSGAAILIALPHLYWGETGAVGMRSFIDLPLPSVVEGQTGWARYLHFLCGWICVLTGLVYIVAGFFSGHFRKDLFPAKGGLTRRSFAHAASNHLRFRLSSAEEFSAYNVFQRLTYLAVIFVLFPLMIWTGLAMSPAVVSSFPGLVTTFGGQQSARTIHFFVACSLVLFLLLHVAMVSLSGVRDRMWAMISGHARAVRSGCACGEEQARAPGKEPR